MIIIELQRVGKIYGADKIPTVALKNISFSVDEGEFIAIMGPSGSGKSTLLHILGYLDRPSSGLYRFYNKTIDDYSDVELAQVRNQKMGFVFQAYNLLSRTTVLENVKLPLLYSNVPASKWDELAKKAIGAVGISHRIRHEPSQLSGGEKQRVAIARALVNNPQIVFADEPTGNLDSKSGGVIMNILEQLNDEGRTVVLITHESYLASIAKRVIKLRDGEIVSDEKTRKRSHAGKE